MLNWLSRFNIFCFLDSNDYHLPHSSKKCIAAAGAISFVQASYDTAFNQMDDFLNSGADWAFGHLSYDLKNAVEGLQSQNPDYIAFPDLSFFCPEILLQLDHEKIEIGLTRDHHLQIFNEILSCAETVSEIDDSPKPEINSRLTRAAYLSRVKTIQDHIHSGDCYELNFCQEFYAENYKTNPLKLFSNLNSISPNPFSAFYKSGSAYCMSASPERFLKKTGNTIISQPIKGTAPRKADAAEDERIKENLRTNEKERAENVMVVDLVRNDLSRISARGTVKVDELCEIYSFPNVHQMISTISGELRNEVKFSDIIKACFPMGSMTGAPKKRVMELIEQYEVTKRGLYSGAIGYINPERDFDFNVIIRSLLYNEAIHYLSFHTGSAITNKSNAEEEYEECLLKGEAIRQVLFS